MISTINNLNIGEIMDTVTTHPTIVKLYEFMLLHPYRSAIVSVVIILCIATLLTWIAYD